MLVHFKSDMSLIYCRNPSRNNAVLVSVLPAQARLWDLSLFEAYRNREICLYELESFLLPQIIHVSYISCLIRDTSPISHLYSVIFWRQLFCAYMLLQFSASSLWEIWITYLRLFLWAYIIQGGRIIYFLRHHSSGWPYLHIFFLIQHP